jgi:succinoglycan biosynthesis transport protein ExoP
MTVLPVHVDQPRALAAPAGVGYQSAEPERSDALNARFLATVLRRRWLLLGATAVGITGLATAYAATRPPVFEATAKIMIGMPQRTDIDLGGLVAGLPVDRERIENEMELLRSREVAREVVSTLALDQRPDFNPALVSPEDRPILERVADLIPSPGDLLRQWGAMEPLDAAGTGAGREPIEDVVDVLIGSLQVTPQGRSHVINLTAEAGDPQLAASIANAVAEVYFADRLQAKLDTLRRATGWLDGRLEALRVEAERKEAAVEDYRSRAGLVATEGAGLAAERLGELNRELAAATAAEAQAQARFSKVQETIATEGASAVPEVLNSRTIQELRAAEAVAAARRAELGGELGPRHPQMLEVQIHLDSVRSQIRAETSRILEGLRNEYEVARTRSSHVQHEIDLLEGSISNRNDAEGQLRVLEREAEAAQEVYRTFLVQANATGHKESLERPEAV